jgi:hypothetical protein
MHPYYCLSYTRGSQSTKCQIRINGRLHDVGQNLCEFLHTLRRHLLSARKPTRSRCSGKPQPKVLKDLCIWIDALCINQRDETEKSKQVQMMGQIYKKAAMVLMWLGSDPRVRAAVETLRNRRATLMSFGHYYEFFKKVDYWSRAWIVQEVVLARRPVVFLESGIYDFSDLSYKMDINSVGDEEWEMANTLASYRLTYKGPSFPQVMHKNILMF